MNSNIGDYSEFGGKLIKYELGEAWHAHWLMNRLRECVRPLVEQRLSSSPVPFDPQDLEHQVLFQLTTCDPSNIRDCDIVAAVDSQFALLKRRFLRLAEDVDLRWLFRGLRGDSPDLNVMNRLRLTNSGGELKAVGTDGYERRVDFRLVTDPKTIALFTNDFHYIHQERSSGETFGLYFEGDDWPWAIETAEPAGLSRGYKRAALVAHGQQPERSIELTRLYTLPGSPLNAISILDGLVAKHYKQRGMETIFTRTMPTYSKSKSTTVAGGMNRVLCLKELKHYFVREVINGVETWRMVSKRFLEAHPELPYRATHENFHLTPAVDVFMSLRPLRYQKPSNVQENMAIYFAERGLPACNHQYGQHRHRHEESAQGENARGNRRWSVSAAVRGLLAGTARAGL